MRLTTLLLFAWLGLCSVQVHAQSALFKELPQATDHEHSGYSYISGASIPEFTSPIGLLSNTSYGNDPAHWNPGFRTASSTTHSFVVGWAENSADEQDGFISKVDPSGGTLWTRHMRQIMNTPDLGWRINDIVIANNVLYVVGSRTDNRGFVASITENGSIVDFTLVEGDSSDTISRLNAINVATIAGQTQIFVTGDVNGYSTLLQVRERQRTAPATTFTALQMRHTHLVDNVFTARGSAVVLRLGTNLAPNWGMSLGYQWSYDFGTAIAADGTGNIFVAVKHENPDRFFHARMHHVVEVGRNVVTSANPSGTPISQGNTNLHADDFHPGSWSTVFQLSTQTEHESVPIRRFFTPNWHPQSFENAANRVVDMHYHQGSLYAGGNFKKHLAPRWTNGNPQTWVESFRDANNNFTNDIWLARLNPTTLAVENWRLLHTPADSYLNQLVPSGDRIFIAGSSGAGMSHRGGMSHPGSTPLGNSAMNIGGSSTPHLFWMDLAVSDLAPGWRLQPDEDGSGSSIPPVQRISGLSVIDDRLAIFGSWSGGPLTMGSTSPNNLKTLPTPPANAHHGFVGLLRRDGSWLEEISITINSAYGQPSPHLGTDTIASGVNVTASVPQEIYEDSQGNIIDSSDADAIRDRAVTRRVCIGYQFENSEVNGTVNSVTFLPQSNVVLTFLWRTEYAIEIQSNIDGTEGLTSTAAGNPQPEVRKHWIRENEPFTAFIDGSDSDLTVPGTRWLSTGYTAYGSVAAAAGVSHGEFVRWPARQNRQQTPQITVGSPGRIVWQWRKQHSFNVGVNDESASDAPWAYNDFVVPTTTFRPLNAQDIQRFHFDYMEFPVAPRRVRITVRDELPVTPSFLIISRADGEGGWVKHEEIPWPGIAVGESYIWEPTNAPVLNPFWTVHVERVAFGFRLPVESVNLEIEILNVTLPPFAFIFPTSHVRKGEGEFWFEPGSIVTSGSNPQVSSGSLLMSLKGYSGGQGSVQPNQQNNLLSKVFTIDRPSRLTWDYERKKHPEEVEVGASVTFSTVTGVDADNINRNKAPIGGSVISGPSGSNITDMYVWDAVAGEVRIVRPGKFTLNFENLDEPEDPGFHVVIEVTSSWPDEPDYTHILETPPVHLDPSSTDDFRFLELTYTESSANVENNFFSTAEPGYSVLLFSRRAGGIATGNLTVEPMEVKVVRSMNWLDSAGGTRHPVTIGTEITDPEHNASVVGHSGYVISPLAPVNVAAYDRDNLSGPIFAVNERYPEAGRWAVELPGATDGLIAHFPLDEQNGTTATDRANDSVANYVSDNPANAPIWQRPGVMLDPSKQERFVAPETTGSGITDQLTLAAWVNVNQFATWNGIINKGLNHQAYALSIHEDGRLIFVSNFNISDDNSQGAGNYYSADSLPAQTWTHVALSYDGSHLRFYINGKLSGSPQEVQIYFAQSNESLCIGVGMTTYNDFWNGQIRDARVYNRPLNQTEITELSKVSNLYPSPGDMSVAWYRVQDNIRWPFKAVNYEPEWPVDPDRIVVASRLGSESARPSAELAPLGYVGGTLTNTLPLWTRPNLDQETVSNEQVYYQAYLVASDEPSNPLYFHSHSSQNFCFLYENGFNPSRPLDNLVAAVSGTGNWRFIYTMTEGNTYVAVVTTQDNNSPFINYFVSPDNGGKVSRLQPTFDVSNFASPFVYHQSNPELPGFNPNEEHARVFPSFLDGSRPAVYALRRHANRTVRDDHFTSEPYVLVQYTDNRDPADPQTRMRVYRVEEEDEEMVDTRLPAFNQAYTFLYQGTAGRRLVPPYPLDLVMGGQGVPAETKYEDRTERIVHHVDKNNMPWLVSGDEDDDPDLKVAWHYYLPADFWDPTKSAGDPVPYAELTLARPLNVKYDSVWPDPVATLKAGETMTFAGGEYAMDRAGDPVPPPGLPQAVSWQAARLVFDSANPSMNGATLESEYLARVVPALEPREVDLPFESIPQILRPASGNVIVEGLLWRFKDLPASLQERIYYNTSTNKLGVRGLLNGRILGDSDLLVAPGAQIVLQPNVLTTADEALIKALSPGGTWATAVEDLATLSRNPNELSLSGSIGIGLQSDSDAFGGRRPGDALGPGIVVITNPALQNPTTAADLPSGYITIAENDDPAFATPVAMHVIRVDREKYRGSLAVLEPENVFDEKLSLQHTADFGGNVGDLYFEWIFREEDGRDLNPPEVALPTAGTPLPGEWAAFAEGEGLNSIQMAGSGPILIRDNLFFARYRHKDDTENPQWSAWAGAANSREPNPDSPSAETDVAYVPQLAMGWIKRVTNAINLFDARIKDFRNNSVPATYTSVMQMAGQRYEGPVAFNPDKDAIENVGLIELYQTVLNRAKDMTIAEAAGSDGVNTALLNAANRIASLYTLFGDEAYADALDPTIGYATVGSDYSSSGFSTDGGSYGALNPTIHAFQNMVPNLLEEELALLRGRAEVGARPAYNRLMWNFTNGPGEAAYVLNYGIKDLDNDGFITDADARRLYPMGHGDAWGHYTMALRGYYHLARLENFFWSPRSEKYAIDGVVLDVDYLDERTFAKTATLRANVGAYWLDLTYRRAYTENPLGQWQGYRDVDADRAWGVFETAQRAGMAALCDWLFVNSLLPAEETDPAKTGIRRVDRTTVPELAAIAASATKIQVTLDKADRGLNPSGLDPNTIPFDIDPSLVTNSGGTHFEQIHARAVASINNAAAAWAHANEIRTQLRMTEATSEHLRQKAEDQDRALRNELIQIFGTPYSGMIGPGKAYPAGYNGPDLYLFSYVDQVAVGGDVLSELADTTMEFTIVPGLRNLANDSNPFNDEATSVHKKLRETVSTFFPADLTLPTEPAGEINLNLPIRASGYAMVAPPEWGMRQHPGEFQAAIQELVQAQWRVRFALHVYEGQADEFQNLLKKFELKSGIASESLVIGDDSLSSYKYWTDVAFGAYLTSNVLDHLRESTNAFVNALSEGIPEIVGTSVSAGAKAKGLLLGVTAGADAALRSVISPLQITQYRAEKQADLAQLDLAIGLLTLERKSELVDILSEIYSFVNSEVDARAAVIDAVESMRAASDRVRMVLGRGMALTEERIAFNTRVASTTTLQRYQDYTFRVFHNEALRKYESAFNLAQRYTYLAAKAYAYELNLPDNHPANPTPLLSQIHRERTLGILSATETHTPGPGLSGILATLKTNFDTLKSQMGLLDSNSEIYQFSLRSELNRTGQGNRVNAAWRTNLENYRVPDLWNYQFEHNGVNYGYVFRRFCRPFAAESAGSQAALVIPFTTTIEAGKNWFGHSLEGGDSTFNSTYFSTKVRSVGVRFRGYNNTVLSHTPQAYLVPVGMDRMYYPNSPTLAYRSWNVVDQRIPAPLAITNSQLADPDWQPFTGSTNGFFDEIRKFSSFRAYHDSGGWTTDQMLVTGRHIGRSVWNTQWVLIIPSVSLRSDSGNPQSGIETFIYGAPLSGYTQVSAGTENRDLMGVHDIELLIEAYSISGN
ncbi:MAG: LamG domain-containing protein [Opitutales bacterium]|nr:LamG domain-containing protein [Opitutales bacterium]